MAGAAIYAILSSGETQWWAKTNGSDNDIIATSPHIITNKEDADEKSPLLSHSKDTD